MKKTILLIAGLSLIVTTSCANNTSDNHSTSCEDIVPMHSISVDTSDDTIFFDTDACEETFVEDVLFNDDKDETATEDNPLLTDTFEVDTTDESEIWMDIFTEAPEDESVIYEYTEDDLFCMAATVCREAGGASEEIKLLVANVIMNRVNSHIYPSTVREVVTQYMQYGTMWKNGVSFPKWANNDVKNDCYSIARRILSGERVCPSNVLFQAEFEQGSGIYKEFPGYYFCYYGK